MSLVHATTRTGFLLQEHVIGALLLTLELVEQLASIGLRRLFVLIVVLGDEDYLCGWRSKLKFWESRVLVSIWGILGFWY